MQKIIVAFFTALIFACGAICQNRTYSSAEVKADLGYLKAALTRTHPNLYIYSSPTRVDSFFEAASRDIPERLTEYQAYERIAGASSVIKDGHTLFNPDPESLAYHNEKSVFFPFSIFWDGEALYIRENLSREASISPGDRILSVNGIPAADIVSRLLKCLMRDGDNPNYALWVMNSFFRDYYSYPFGHPDKFRLVVAGANGVERPLEVEGLPKSEIRAIKAARFGPPTPEKAIFAYFDQPRKTAVLTIRDWHRDLLRKEYGQRFPKVIRPLLKGVLLTGVEHLVIDLRNNQGGNMRYSKRVLKFLLDKPFHMIEGYYTVSRKAGSAPESRLTPTKGSQLGLHRPDHPPFRGEVYVLTNGGSFSNSGIFCSALQRYGRATFVGEETGGSAFVLSADTKTFTLPNTRIQVEMPTLQYLIRQQGTAALSGIKPDHPVRPRIDDLIRRRDAAMEAVLELIKIKQP